MTEGPIKKEVSKHLSDKDRLWITKAGVEIMGELLKDFPDNLPNVIIFPETSACPLIDLVKPILSKVAASRGKVEPKYYFFDSKSSTAPQKASEIREELKKNGIEEAKIVVIDDYVSINLKTTNQIRQAFLENVPVYAFIGEEHNSSLNAVKSAYRVSWSEDLRGGFDYRNTKVGQEMLVTGTNPLQQDLQSISREIISALQL